MIFKYSKYLVISVVTAFLLLVPNVVFSKIIFKKVVTTGVGQSLEEAVNNALAEAISMVNGKNIQTKTVIQVLGGEFIPQDKKTNSILSQILEAIKSSEDNKNKKVIEKKVKEKPKAPEYSQKYVKDLVDETKGGVKSYKITKKSKNKIGWDQVEVESEVAVFDLPQEAKRTRVAILPFRLFDVAGDKEKLKRRLSQELNNYLVQTRKFTVLDRNYIEEISKEKQSILDGKSPAIEMAKIGNEISADFIFVGSIEDFKIKEKIIKILTSDKEIKRKSAQINLNYRLIDVATKQIYYTNTIKHSFGIKDKSDSAESGVSEVVAKKIGEEILFSIYPVLVEKLANGELYLGQGGNQFKTDDKYEIFEKGEKIIDSYTKEVLGNVETSKGQVAITQVTSNYTKAKFLKKTDTLEINFVPGKYLVRPIKLDSKASEEQIYKKNKEIIDKQREERKKKLEKDF